jgi:hypothetical protein
MALSKDDKDEIRYIVQQEIGKAFKAGLSAAVNVPINLGEAVTAVTNKERQERNKLIKSIGQSIKSALTDLEDEANAKIVEKTDPARADVIRRLKPTF